jgi:hypothetical protein
MVILLILSYAAILLAISYKRKRTREKLTILIVFVIWIIGIVLLQFFPVDFSFYEGHIIQPIILIFFLLLSFLALDFWDIMKYIQKRKNCNK